AREAISFASFGFVAMIGEAPKDNKPFAVKFCTTVFVKQCTKGPFARMCSIIVFHLEWPNVWSVRYLLRYQLIHEWPLSQNAFLFELPRVKIVPLLNAL